MQVTKIFSAVVLVISAVGCGGASDRLVSHFNGVTVSGERGDDGRIETTLTDASGESKLALSFDGKQVEVTPLIDNAVSRILDVDATKVGTGLEAWNRMTYVAYQQSGQSLSGEGSSSDAIQSHKPIGSIGVSNGPDSDSCVFACMQAQGTFAECLYWCAVLR